MFFLMVVVELYSVSDCYLQIEVGSMMAEYYLS